MLGLILEALCRRPARSQPVSRLYTVRFTSLFGYPTDMAWPDRATAEDFARRIETATGLTLIATDWVREKP